MRTKIEELMERQNQLFAHQNAAIDLLASDKRAEMVHNIEEIAELVANDELLEVMDYGDQISFPWKDTTNNQEYNPPFNFCHLETAQLEDGEPIKVADCEWEYTIPFGIPYDEPEAIFESDSVTPAGTYYFTIENDSWGGNNGKNIQFTLPSDLPAGAQIRKSVEYNVLVTNGTLDVYSGADSRTKLYSMTPTEGMSGTFLGKTNGTGNLNHWHRVALGYARWSKSFLRTWLNATGDKGTYYIKQNKWDVKPSQADSYDGFLKGYSEEILHYMKPTKIVTYAANADGNVKDETYDRVFLSSLTEMYAQPFYTEGEPWEYYKRLLGVTSPVPLWQTYPRLIKYALNNVRSAQYCWRRSANVSYLCNAMIVNSSGTLSGNSASYAIRSAPCVRIGK